VPQSSAQQACGARRGQSMITGNETGRISLRFARRRADLDDWKKRNEPP
jgi:hypothetical protein